MFLEKLYHNNWGPVASFGLPSSLDPSCPPWQGLWGCTHWLKRKITRSRWEPSIDPQVWGWERWTGHFIMAVGIWGFEDECSYFSRCNPPMFDRLPSIIQASMRLTYIIFHSVAPILYCRSHCFVFFCDTSDTSDISWPASCPHGVPMVAIAKRSAPAIAPHGLRPPGRKAHEDAAAWIGGTKSLLVVRRCWYYVFILCVWVW